MEEKLNLSPQAILDKEFGIDFKGYNPDQVDLLLDAVIKDYQTYQALLDEYKAKVDDLQKTNASLRAKLLEEEAKTRVREESDPISSAASNVDILKRLSRLEKEVFENKQ